MRRARSFATLAISIATIGCLERQGRPVDPCTYSSVAYSVGIDRVDKVDLLFMVDNSNSMAAEQALLIDQFDEMVAILATGDFDQNGRTDDPVDFEPVRDLNVGVVTSDMGTGGFTVPTCANADFGDDGILNRTGYDGDAACAGRTFPAFLDYQPASGASAAQFARDFGCLATVGTGGCGFEQQLEASLKAVMPSGAQSWTADGFAPVTFFRGTPGHGDLENAGLVRDNSVLAVIVVTDEEDCSVRDPAIFDPASPTYSGEYNLRCFAYGAQALHPTSRYVDGLLSLRRRPGMLVYGAIAGVPPDLIPADPDERIDFDRILADPRMHQEPDPTQPGRLRSSCGDAFPPPRLVEVARDLEQRGAGVTLASICSSSFRDALLAIIRRIDSALGNDCLPRPLNRNADGSVDCEVVVTMPPGSDCSALPGATPRASANGDPLVEDGRSVCVLRQLVATDRTPGAGPPPGDGWYYDDFSNAAQMSCGQRIAPTMLLPTGSQFGLECLQNVLSGRGEVSLGTFCDPSAPPSADKTAPNPCLAGEVPGAIAPCAGGAGDPRSCSSCDPIARSCGVACATDADCRSSGLVGFVCDRRARGDVDPDNFPGDAAPYAFCVNPTCGQ